MKRYFISLLICVVAIAAHAELNTNQLQLRRNVVSVLGDAGYKPNIDNDGDVFFDVDGTRYWVNVIESWKEPCMLALFTEFPYNSDKGRTKENVMACVSVVNQFKGVKLLCRDRVYHLRNYIICDNADAFRGSFKAVLTQLQKAQDYISKTVNSGLAGMDLTGNRDNIYNKAMELYKQGDYNQAVKLFEYLADNKYPLAYSMLGLMYEKGRGVARDERKMVDYYRLAIDNGQSLCAYKLGTYYFEHKDYAEAMNCLEQSSSSENPFRAESYFLIGRMYEDGKGVERSLTTAVRNYRKAVEYSSELESDGRKALMRLGEQVENPADFTDISKSMLSGLGADEMFRKGVEYENGLNNRTVSLPKAFGYFKAAAEKEHPAAYIKMGEIYLSPYYPFNDKDKADKYYSKALKALKKQENYSPDANYQLGLLYKDGLGVEKDPARAMTCFKTAAAKGNAGANYELGLIYQTELERVEAFNCFMKAAENGVPAAMLEVAKAYETGLGTARSREKAAEWYRRCADTDSAYSKTAAEALGKIGIIDDEKE